MRRKKGELRPKQAVFAERMASGLSRVAAARAADYKDPNTEASRLLSIPDVRDTVIEGLQKKAVKWTELLTLSLQRLREFLEPEECACPKCGEVVWTPPDYKPETVLYAIKINLDTMQKAGLGASLRDKAEAEDVSDVVSAARRLLGDRPGVKSATEH